MTTIPATFLRAVGLLFLGVTVPLFAATLTVTNTSDSGPGSLRNALGAAAAGDKIEFSIGSGGAQTIQPLTRLPAPGACIAIDGTTQPGYAGKPLIEIDGSLIPSGGGSRAIGITACGSIRGLVINNFREAGILVADYGPATIRGCYIGTSADGSAARGNNYGIQLPYGFSHAITIGGAGEGDGNLISGNSTGIDVYAARKSFSVQGNVFGSDAQQTKSLGQNTHINISQTAATIGGVAPNVFLGGYYGVYLSGASGTTVVGNRFGSSSTGKIIAISQGVTSNGSHDVLIGSNTIAGNARGIWIESNSLRNTISGNAIKGNTIGIDLSPHGPTPNDPGDSDVGANNLTNYPVITNAFSFGNATTITGTLNAAANRTYNIELFRSIACNSSGYGDGEGLIDRFSVTTDGAGNASFTRSLANATPVGNVITATATSVLEGTSELSRCAAVEGNGAFALGGGPVNETEGRSITLNVQRTLGANAAATVDWTATGGTATAGTDYSPASGTLSFAIGETSKSFAIQLTDDTAFEGNESFTVALSNPTNGTTVIGDKVAVTIVDDEPRPSLFSPGASVVEGNAGTTTEVTLQVGLSQAVPIPIEVSYATNSGSATPGTDYVAASGKITFAAGQTQQTLTFVVNGDDQLESDEYFWVSFNSGQVANYNQTINIRDDETPPTVSVEDASVRETDGITKVQVRFAATAPISGSLYYYLVPVTAQIGVDFADPSDYYDGASVHFQNERSKKVEITILGDDDAEIDETFQVVIYYAPWKVDIGKGTATVAILNDDTGVGPREQYIAVGATGSYAIDVGLPVAAPAVIQLGSSNPAVEVPSSVTIPAGRSGVHFPARAIKAGELATISVRMPAELEGDVFTVKARTYTATDLVFDPQQLQMFVGQTANVQVRLEPAAAEALTIPLSGGGNVELPSTITINPGETATFSVKAATTGPIAIQARLPRDAGNREAYLFGEVSETPAAPTILRISPPNGPSAGGTNVEIEGVQLAGDCRLSFGGIPATAVRLITRTLLGATTPPHEKGVVDVVLTCGKQSSTFASGFTYVDSTPRISHVAPSAGSVAGGTQVRVAGEALRSSCWPFFGGVAAPSGSLESPSAFVAATPAHAAGTIDVVLRCPGGDVSAAGAFAYLAGDDPAASIMTVTPLAAAPGEEVTVTGTRFRADDRATFGNTTRATIVRTAPDSHVLVVPELPPGRVSVDLTDRAGRTTTTGPIFSVLESSRPRITSITPASAPAGAEIELHGEGFRAGYSFEIGGRRATVVSMSWDRAVVLLPAGFTAGKYAVDIINAGGQLASIGPEVTVTSEGLAIKAVSARCSTTSGGAQLTISGSGFENSMLVAFEAAFATAVKLVDASTIVVTVPPGEAGPARIRITRTDGATATWSGFRYASPYDPNGCSNAPRGGRAVRH